MDVEVSPEHDEREKPVGPAQDGAGSGSRVGRRWLWTRGWVVAVLAAVAGVVVGAGGTVLVVGSEPPPATLAAPAQLPVDPVDAGFATDMLDHHQQALQMSLLALDKATTTPVRSLATRMIVSQQSEAGRFLQYLEERGLRQGDPDREVMAWMGMPMPRRDMPGLASPQELVALTNASGVEVDRLFLDLMIRHHEGGLHMAAHAAEHATNEPLRSAAARMSVMQRREIADMELLRGGLDASGPG
jgi:uncharacterized protein (DUF305 family)